MSTENSNFDFDILGNASLDDAPENMLKDFYTSGKPSKRDITTDEDADKNKGATPGEDDNEDKDKDKNKLKVTPKDKTQSGNDMTEEEIEFYLKNKDKNDKTNTKNKADDKGTNGGDNTSDLEESPFKLIAEAYVEKGLFNELPKDFKGTEEEFFELEKAERKTAVEEEINSFSESLPEEGKALLKHIRNGGKVSDFVESYSDDIDGLDPKDEANQRLILDTFYKNTMPYLKPDKRAAKIEKLIDAGLAEEEADGALEQWKTIKATKQQELEENTLQSKIQAEENRKQIVSEINEFVTKSESIKGALPIGTTPKQKKEFLDYIFKPSVKLKNGSIVTQNQADEMKENDDLEAFLAKIWLRKNKYNLDPVKTSAKTAAVSNLTEKLKNATVKIRSNGDDNEDKTPDVKASTKAWSWLD